MQATDAISQNGEMVSDAGQDHPLPQSDSSHRFLDALLAAGRLDAASIARAKRFAVQEHELPHRVLTKLGLISEAELAGEFSRFLHCDLLNIQDYPSVHLPLEKVSPKFLRNYRIVPIAYDGGRLVVAMSDPLDQYAINALRLSAGCDITVKVGIPVDIERTLVRLYEGHPSGDLDEDSSKGEFGEEEVARLRDLASEAPVVKSVSDLVNHAVEVGASDIHIDPLETRLRVRLRLDGELMEVDAPPVAMKAAVISRIKIMAKLDIAERRLPQDGRINTVVRGQSVDLRVSTVPTLHGESVVLRILNRSAVALDFDALGFDAKAKKDILSIVSRPNGIFLVTGPTGSGKTTTLYACLRHLNAPEKNVITVEDPIEYQLQGINQIQVKPEIGLTFADVLRSLLRHDPDILMVGEIRDVPTAEVAVQAALTGHLVLSTLHTNSAASSLARLLDMGVESYLISSSLIGVLAQRLVRKLCRSCASAYDMPPELVRQLGLEITASAAGPRVYRAVGCDKCRGSGYVGRTAVYETIIVDDNLQKMILRQPSASELHKAALASGMRSLFQSAMDKALSGETSLEEVYRVAQQD